MMHAVRRLMDADIPVTELSLRLPSLDEVFFTLTGGETFPDVQPLEGVHS